VSAPLDAAIEDLLSGNPARQAHADSELHRLAGDASLRHALLEKLTPLVDHDSTQVRLVALQVVASVLGEQALPMLEAHAGDPDSEVRAAVEDAAEELGPAAKSLLSRFLEDPEFVVRFWAASALAETGEAAAFPVLVEGLDESSTRFEALYALRALADPRALEPARHIFAKWGIAPTERAAAAGVLARLGDAEGKAYLVAELDRKRSHARGLAVELCGDLKLTEAAEALERILHDRQDLMRGAAAISLGRMKVARLVPELSALLADANEDPDLRADFAEALAAMGGDEAGKAISAAIASAKEPELREALEEARASFEGR